MKSEVPMVIKLPMTIAELLAMSPETRHLAIEVMTLPSDPSRKVEDWDAWGDEIDQHPICSPTLILERQRRTNSSKLT
jgi:hypothetical protein